MSGNDHRASKPRLRRIKRFAAGLGTLIVVGFLAQCSGMLRWSPINNWNDLVDIKSGRVRHTRKLLYVTVRDEIEETEVSQLLAAHGHRFEEPDWRMVNKFSPGVGHSPHYLYHGAIAQLNQLELIWQTDPFTEDAKYASAARLLELWDSGGDFSANEFLSNLGYLGGWHESQGIPDRPLTVDDILDPPPWEEAHEVRERD